MLPITSYAFPVSDIENFVTEVGTCNVNTMLVEAPTDITPVFTGSAGPNPDEHFYQHLGLIRLSMLPQNFPWAKA